MKKMIVSILFIFGLATSSWATTFTFNGVAANGTGSAVMDVSILGDVLTLRLDNTSPILTSTSDDNIPAIIAFGWDLQNSPLPTIDSWSLKTFDKDNNEVFIDDYTSGGTEEWEIDSDGKLEGTSLDFIPNNDGASTNVAAALYNPAAKSILASDGQTPHYFTQAILTMDFSAVPIFSFEAGVSPYVRMQRVGDDAEGSLKLFGVPEDNGGGTGDPVPEPGTIVLVGAGLVGLALLRKKQSK